MNKRFVNTMGGRREGECVAVLPAVFKVFLEALKPAGGVFWSLVVRTLTTSELKVAFVSVAFCFSIP